MFFVTFIFLLFDNGICFHFNKGKEVNLKINQKSDREHSQSKIEKE